MKYIITESQHSFLLGNIKNEIIKELNFQKKFLLTNLTLKENLVDKLSFVESHQKNLVKGLYGGNSIIMENYSQIFNSSIIFESTYDFESEIDRFNNFLVDSLLHHSENLFEQIQNATTGITNLLSNALSYINQYGIARIMEGLRSALLSGVGTAIQIALSFTGVGAIANEIAWGIMTLYDAYQLFVNKTNGSTANLIIDLICLLTAGNLGKTLKGFVNLAGEGVGTVLQSFMKSGVGKYITPILGKLEGGMASLLNFLGQASKFMENKMGIKWVASLLNPVKTFFMDMLGKLNGLLGKGISKLGTPIVRAAASLGAKFEAQIFSELGKKSEQELAKLAGETITKTEIKAAEKYAEENLKEKPTKEAMAILDKNFGTKMSNVYSTYLASKKLASNRAKIGSGEIGVVDVGADALRGDNTAEKGTKYANKIRASF
jgi:hypothetical protein